MAWLIYSKKFFVCILLLMPLTAWGSPSRGFIQEFGLAAPAGEIAIDVLNTTGEYTKEVASQFRAGTPFGEVWLSMDKIGFKTLMQRRLAVYINAGASSHEDEELAIDAGFAYRLVTNRSFINFNPEIKKQNGENIMGFNGALFLRLPTPMWMGSFQLGGEFSLYDNDSKPRGAAGLRWIPKPYVTADVMLVGSGGTKGAVVRTPAALRVSVSWY